jgi:hypothetical protein
MSLEASASPTLQLVNPNDDAVITGITNESTDIVIQRSPVPDHIAERPSSPITVMFGDTETESEEVGGSVNDVVAEDTVAVLVDETNSLLENTNVSIASDSIKNGLLEEFDTMWSNSVTPLNKSAMMKIVVRAMELVEKTDIKGQEQQNVVIDVLVEILESDIVVSVHKDSLVAFLKEDAGDVISLLVDASKGKININRLENIATRLFKKFGKCFAS